MSSGSRWTRYGIGRARVACFADQLDVKADDVYAVPGPLDLRVLMGLAELPGFDELRDPPLQPVDVLAGGTAATSSRCWTSATCCCIIPTTPTTR